MNLLTELKSLVGEKNIFEDDEAKSKYGQDWTRYYSVNPLAVALPTSIEQLQDIVLWARKHHIALVPSGGRSGLSAGAVAHHKELVVSLERMNQILDFNPIDRVVTVQAGVITEVLQKFAESKGLYYPVDFAARGSSQIGGNVATNAGGIKVIRYGLTRNWITGLKVVTGRGEILDLNRSLVKNATGYDLRHLFIGSEGTLGFIAEVSLRLDRPIVPQEVMMLGASHLDAIMEIFNLFQQKVSISAFEMFSEQAMSHVIKKTGLARPFTTHCPYYVLIESDQVLSEESPLIEAFETALAKGWALDGTVSQSPTQSKQLWRLREDITESVAEYTPYKNDISVRISHVPRFMNELDEALKKAYPNVSVIWFGHVGDGNLHISILKPDTLTKDEFLQHCRKMDEIVFSVVKKFGGSISAEHGVGMTKKSHLHYSLSLEEIELMKGIKKVFDPDGIMNPGKLI